MLIRRIRRAKAGHFCPASAIPSKSMRVLRFRDEIDAGDVVVYGDYPRSKSIAFASDACDVGLARRNTYEPVISERICHCIYRVSVLIGHFHDRSRNASALGIHNSAAHRRVQRARRSCRPGGPAARRETVMPARAISAAEATLRRCFVSSASPYGLAVTDRR